MKTKLVILLIAVLPLFFVGCEKSEAPIDKQTAQTPNAELKIEADLCGDAMPIVFKNFGTNYFPSYETGSGEIGNDEEKLYLRIEAPENGYTIRHYLGYIGSVEDFVALGNTIDPNDPHGEAHMQPGTWNIPKVTLIDQGLTTIELEFLLADFPQPQPGDCYIVAFVGNFTNGPDTKWGWMVYEGSYKSDGYYIDYCVQECTPNNPPPSIGSETCFAYGDQYAYCFREFKKKTGQYNPNGPANKNFSRWGWTNGELEEGNTYIFDVWAGAGQCDLTKGTLVGDLTIEYYGSNATVTYEMISGYALAETHLYIGDEQIPTAHNGKATVAPGQYPYSDGDATTVEDDLVIYEINNLSGNIWVVAHGVAEDAQ